jgi:hypothetical protein
MGALREAASRRHTTGRATMPDRSPDCTPSEPPAVPPVRRKRSRVPLVTVDDHGWSGYKRGCGCDVCTRANYEKVLLRRERLGVKPRSDRFRRTSYDKVA